MEGDTRINVDIPDVTDANVVLEKLGDAGKIYFIYGQSSQGEENITFDAENGGYKLARPLEDIIADGTAWQPKSKKYNRVTPAPDAGSFRCIFPFRNLVHKK